MKHRIVTLNLNVPVGAGVVVGITRGGGDSVRFAPTQIPSSGSGKRSHCKLSGQLKPMRFKSSSQPSLALSHSERQGGMGSLNTVHTGAYLCDEVVYYMPASYFIKK